MMIGITPVTVTGREQAIRGELNFQGRHRKHLLQATSVRRSRGRKTFHAGCPLWLNPGMNTLFGQPDVEAILRTKIKDQEQEISGLKNELHNMAVWVAQDIINDFRNGDLNEGGCQGYEVVIDDWLKRNGIDLTYIREKRERGKREAREQAALDEAD
jgi:hypothetical protein